MNKASLKIIWIFLMGAFIFTIVGCQTPQSPNPNIAKADDPLTATNRYGLSLRDAQDKSLKLQPGMTQDEVVLLLCKPDETSAGTFGTQTPKPWNGVVWMYHWGLGLWSLRGPNPHDKLTIVFEKGLDTWVVNSWYWSGP
jgi:hypothetical protein